MPEAAQFDDPASLATVEGGHASSCRPRSRPPTTSTAYRRNHQRRDRGERAGPLGAGGGAFSEIAAAKVPMAVPKAMPIGAARRASSQSRSQNQTSAAVRAPHSNAETTINRMMARRLAY